MEILKALRSGHWPSLLAAWLHFEVSFATWVLLAALSVFITQDFGLSATQKGFMVAVPLLSGALGRIAVGACTDRFGPRRTGLISMLLVTVPLTWAWRGVTSFSELIALALFLGIAGTSLAVSLPLASRAYPPAHQGLAMGVAGSGNSGAIFSLALAPVAAESIGWHGVFGAMIPVVLVTVILYGLLASGHDPIEQTAQRPRNLRSLLRNSNIYWFCLFYSVTFGGFVGFSSYLSLFFFDQYGLSRVQAGWVAAACALAGSFSRPIGGYIADHWGGLRTLAVLYPTITILAAMTALLLPFTETFASVLLLMVGLGLGNGVIFQVIPLRFRKEIGIVSGLVGAAGGVGGFFLPSLLGLFRDLSGTYATGFGIFAALCGLLIPVIVVYRSRIFEKAYTGI